MINKARQVLQKYWNYPDFRPDQKRVVESILGNTDTLALLPTGGGKSICYQAPGLVMDGTVLVISPLIALMNDQVENLKSRNISAIAITSSMNYKEVQIALDNAVYGKYKFLYVSPERISGELFQQKLRDMTISLFAIDEAHCISQWGFDFRPSYLKLSVLREIKPDVPILALTASAPEKVIEDIRLNLCLKNESFITGNFIRPNLSYFFINTDNKANHILKILKKKMGSGIIYTYTRKDAREFAQWLKTEGIGADYYHGGMTYKDREKARLNWMSNQNPIMCATNAFGMGIDKPDVKLVVHQGLPLSIEAYYQEAGRAGRNGEKAWAILLYSTSDLDDLRSRLELSFPELDFIKHIYKVLINFYLVSPGTGAGKSFPFQISEICKRYKLKPIQVYSSMKFLEKEGYISLSDSARTPSRVFITTSQKALYNYGIKDKKIGKSIEVLLRSYTGLFDDFQTINESLLAQRIQIERKTLVYHFHQLHKMELIVYREQTETPWVTFTEDVALPQNLHISPKNYHNLKVISNQRLDAFIHLVESKNQCRNTIILDYLKVETHKDCGICDVCISKRKVEFNQDKFVAMRSKIIKMHSQSIAYDKIIDSFSSTVKEDAIHLISYLKDEGIL
ncbi:MAG: ATP-dependent DNA helicase RecQ [Salibacteraceae bacterium]|jgi:ATP-dependent DNA helicase RecQ